MRLFWITVLLTILVLIILLLWGIETEINRLLLSIDIG